MTNNSQQTYIEVGGNVEVIVVAGLAGTYKLDVGDVPAEARGGAVLLSTLSEQVFDLTDALRTGTDAFVSNLEAESSTLNVASGAGAVETGTGTTLGSSGGLSQDAALALVASLFGVVPPVLDTGGAESAGGTGTGVNAALGYTGQGGLGGTPSNVGLDNPYNLMPLGPFALSIRSVSDDVFRLYQEANEQLFLSWQNWSSPPLGVLNLAASQPWRELAPMGLNGGGQELLDARAAHPRRTAEALGKGSNLQVQAPKRSPDAGAAGRRRRGRSGNPGRIAPAGPAGDLWSEPESDVDAAVRDRIFSEALFGEAAEEETDLGLLALAAAAVEWRTEEEQEPGSRRKHLEHG